MLEVIAIVLVTIVFATLLQEKIWLPSVLSYIVVWLVSTHFFPEILSFKPEDFHTLVLITLPFLIASDFFGITWKMVKRSSISIFLLAVVNVVFTVVAIVIFGNFLLAWLSILMLVILASTISPTDPVWVNAALSNFKVPHKLSFKLESESLANDVVALSLFSVAVLIYSWELALNW
jgi:NhaP-type Na+/H+ or K+/H+ antiporter